jgi:WD40 repeat protein
MKSEYNTLEFDIDRIRQIMQKQKEERIRKEQEEQKQKQKQKQKEKETKNKNNQTKINNKKSKTNASLGEIIDLKPLKINYNSNLYDTNVSAVQFRTDSNQLMVASERNFIDVFMKNDKKNTVDLKKRYRINQQVHNFANNPIKPIVIINVNKENTLIISRFNQKIDDYEIKAYLPLKNKTNQIAYSPCGEYIAISSLDNFLRIYKHVDISFKEIVKKEHDNLLNQIAFSYDNKYVISGCDNGDLYVYRNELEKKNSLDLIMTMPFPEIIKGLSFTRDNKYFVTNQNYSDTNQKNHLTFHAYDFEKRIVEKAISYPLSKYEVNSIDISPSNKYIALGTNDTKSPLKVFEIIRK